MKKCVYTCITGNYDDLKEIKYAEKGFDYICFTNNKKIKSDFWKIIYLDERIDNWTLARKVKILHHLYLPDYDFTVWIDGNVDVRKPISLFIKEQAELNKYDMTVFNHEFRDCIYDEMGACILANKETVENVDKLRDFLLSEKYPKHNGLVETGVLVRKNCESVNKLMNFWFNMLSNYTNRDQLTFNYALFKNPIRIKKLNIHVSDNDYFYIRFHNQDSEKVNIMLYYGSLNNFDYHNVRHLSCSLEELKHGLVVNKINDSNQIEIVVSRFNLKLNAIDIGDSSVIADITNVINVGNDNYFYGEPHIIFKNVNTNKLKFKLDLSLVDYKKLTSLYVSLVSDKLNLLNTVNNLTLDNNRYKKELNILKHSTSWKITKPLRFIKSLFKNDYVGKFDMYKPIINNNKEIINNNNNKGLKKVIMNYFKEGHNYTFDLNKPVTLDEKLSAYKLKYNDLFVLCSDKIKAREYVSCKVGEDILIPSLYIGKKLSKRVFNKLPNEFVVKTNNGSGSVEVVMNKKDVSYKDLKRELDDWLSIEYGYIDGELWYNDIEKGIIVEKRIADFDNMDISDYKFYCFNGEPKLLYVSRGLKDHSTATIDFYDINLNKLDVTRKSYRNSFGSIEKPKNYGKMVDIARKLSEDFEFVRVDLYNVNGKIYFSELTFCPAGGNHSFANIKDDEKFGKLWNWK